MGEKEYLNFILEEFDSLKSKLLPFSLSKRVKKSQFRIISLNIFIV
jgi:hypothetical protein